MYLSGCNLWQTLVGLVQIRIFVID